MAEAAVAAIAEWAGASLTTAEIAGWALALETVVVAGVAAVQNSEARRRARNAQKDTFRDRETTFDSAVAPGRVIYGEDRVSGPIIARFSSGVHDEFLHLIIPLAIHPCESIGTMWFGDVELPEPDAQGYIRSGPLVRRTQTPRNLSLHTDINGTVTLPWPSGSMPVITVSGESGNGPETVPFTHTLGTTLVTGLPADRAVTVDYVSDVTEPLIRIKRHLGGADQQVDPDLLADVPDAFLPSDVGRGITYMYWRLEYDPVFDQYGLQDLKAYVRGARLFDPRTGTTAYSTNAQLVVRDYLLSPVYGYGAAADEVPDSETIAGANICDERVAVQGIYDAAYVEQFVDDLGGWTASGATLVHAGDGTAVLTSTSANPTLVRDFSIAGSDYRYLRARIKRLAGSSWQGAVYYATAGHTYSETYKREAAAPVFGSSGWAVVEWDMHAFGATGNDWQQHIITSLRIDLGAAADDVFAIDWIAFDGARDQARYAAQLSFTLDSTPREILEDLLAAMAGYAVWVQGRWLLRPGAYRAPELTLDESIIGTGGVNVAPDVSRGSGLCNAVRVTYRGPETKWEEVQAPIVENDQYTAADGGTQVVTDVQLPYVADVWRAVRMARIILERARQSSRIALTTTLRGYNLAPTDTCALSLELPGYAGKVFEVEERSWGGSVDIAYSAVETAPEIYAWNDGEPTIGDPAPDTTLRSPFTPPAALANLQVESGSQYALRIADDSWLSRARVSWTPSTDTYVTQGGRIEVEWFEPGQPPRALPFESGDAGSTYIAPAPLGAIGVRARARNALGIAGPWSTVAINVPGGIIAPGTDAFAIELPANASSRIRTNSGATAELPGDIIAQTNAVTAEVAAGSWTNTTAAPLALQVDGYLPAIGYPGTIAWAFDLRLLVARVQSGETVETAALQYGEMPRAGLVAHVAAKGKPTPGNFGMTVVGASATAEITKTPLTPPITVAPGETVSISLRLHAWINGVPANSGDYDLTYFGSYVRGLIRKLPVTP